jgi:nitrite reductase/ring-hydroxylating ferredoxin subunit
MNKLLVSILDTGTYLVVSDFKKQTMITAWVREFILSAAGDVAGAAARADLTRRGLGYLHLHLPADEISTIRDRIMPSLRPDLFNFACQLGEELFGLDREFFIDDYTILRINYPYEIGLNSSQSAENPGIGRVDPQVKSLKNSTQTRDQKYDPKSYHKHTPPASWAHGPHKDTWTGHSRQGVNLWWAISDVVEENSMIFYPSSFGINYQVDPRSLYLAAGHPLPKPKKMALHSGEMLIFNPEILHATHLNTSGLTRIALSARINPSQPKFDPACFYAREFWHSSLDINQGKMDIIRQFKREENLEETPQDNNAVQATLVKHSLIHTFMGSDGRESIRLDDIDSTSDRHLVELSNGQQVTLFQDGDKWMAIQSTCPHLDTSLLDGYCGATHIYCPAHGVAYNLENGLSSSPLLRLKTYHVEIDSVYLRIMA